MKLGGEYYTENDLKDAGFRKIGKDIKIHSRSSIYGTENISLGDHVRVDDFTIIIASGAVEIGSHVHIANHVYIGGTYGVVLEDCCGVAHGSKIFTASNDYGGEWLTGPTVPSELTSGPKGQVTVGRHAIIGAGSIIFPGCNVGEGSSVGAMSLVNRTLEPWGLYYGIPARKVRDRKKDLLAMERKVLEMERMAT